MDELSLRLMETEVGITRPRAMSQRKEAPLPSALFLLLVQAFDGGDKGGWYTGGQ